MRLALCLFLGMVSSGYAEVVVCVAPDAAPGGDGSRLRPYRNYTQPPWSTKYPRLAAIMKNEPRQPLGNTVRRNVFVNCTKQACDFDDNVRKLLDKLDIADNLVVNTTGATNGLAAPVRIKGFINLSGTKEKPIDLPCDDLTVQSFASRWRPWLQKAVASLETIPFDRIGLYQDAYLYLLREAIARARRCGRDVAAAEHVLADAQRLVEIPNAGGLQSGRVLPDPDAVLRVKENIARAIEGLR
ncbi:MAG: hypothetical protein ABSF26_04810 [Thermoguttaceae bacterium]